MKPKNASLKDVAEQAGVSKSTASRILMYLSTARRTPQSRHLSLLKISTYAFTVASGIFWLKML
ncbi:MAG: LacI family DNA-binding transcriptional regulator [Planctomycetota bacterium]